MIAPGAVYVAPPDHHLLVNKGGRLTLTQTELVHFAPLILANGKRDGVILTMDGL